MRALFISIVCWYSLVAQSYRMEYTVSIPDPDKSKIKIEIDLRNVSDKKLTLAMPAWAPGSYRTVNYGRWIDSIKAYDSKNQKLSIIKKNINTWEITTTTDIRRISYIALDIPEDSLETLPTSLSDFTSAYYFFNGTAVFAYIPNLMKDSCRINYNIPCGWRVFCPLYSPFDMVYTAENYDQLADSPVLTGDSKIVVSRYTSAGAKYSLIGNSEKSISLDSLVNPTRLITNYWTNFFGQSPFKEYAFIFNFYNKTSGALEHRDASAYYLPPPAKVTSLNHPFYTRIISHEFFHVWNPKIIRSKELYDFNYQSSPKLASLWFIEGLTEYYAKLGLVRSGVAPRSYFYEELKQLLSTNLSANLETLSYKSSLIGVAPEMYVKGALMSFLMDIEIRSQSNLKSSLDSFVLYMHRNFGLTQKTYGDKNVISLLKQATGIDMRTFYKNYIAGGSQPLFREILEKAGLIYEVQYAPYYGWLLDINDNNELVVSSVSASSTASTLGLNSGDVILEIQGKSIPNDVDGIRQLIATMESLKAGEVLQLKINRQNKTRFIKGPIVKGGAGIIHLDENPNANEKQKAIREGLFKGL